MTIGAYAEGRPTVCSAQAEREPVAAYTGDMQLRNARLCLDCEEVHDSDQCPTCASETFAFITRWVPAPERRANTRSVEPPATETVTTYKQMLASDKGNHRWTLVKGGAMGLAVFGVAQWLLQRNTNREAQSTTDISRREQGGPSRRVD